MAFSILIGICIWELIDTLFPVIKNFSGRIFDWMIIPVQQDPCLFRLGQLLYGLGKQITVSVLPRKEDVRCAVKALICDLYGAAADFMTHLETVYHITDHRLL